MADDLEPWDSEQHVEPESIATGGDSSVDAVTIGAEVQRIKQELEMRAVRTPGIDDHFRGPLSWINSNLAWIAGIGFFCIISLRIAAFSEFDYSTVAAVTQAANVQTMTLQLIPSLLPYILLIFTQIAVIHISNSRSVLATPCVVVLVTFSLALIVTLCPFPVGIAYLLLLGLICFGYYRSSRAKHKLWYIEAFVAHIEERQAKTDADIEQYQSMRDRLEALMAPIEQSLSDDPSDENKARLASSVEEVRTLNDEIGVFSDEVIEYYEVTSRLVKDFTTKHKIDVDDTPKADSWFDRKMKNAKWRMTGTIVMIGFLSTLTIALMAMVADSPPWMPAQKVQFVDGKHIVAYELDKTLLESTWLTASRKAVTSVDNSTIKSHSICIVNVNTYLSQSAFQIVLGKQRQPGYPNCPSK